MHLHFVQSLEPLQGAGLGQAALSLHLAIRRGKSGQCSVDSVQSDPPPASVSQPHAPRFRLHASSPHAPNSVLLATRATDFDQVWPDVIQGVRRWHPKMFYAPELKRLAAEAVEEAEWFHGHGLYVWLNMWLGGEARKRGKPLVYHPHGFFDPWILRRSRGKKRLAHWLFEDKNIAHVRWWRALSNKEAEQIRDVVGDRAVVHVIPNGIDIAEVDALDTHEVDSFQFSVGSAEPEASDGKGKETKRLIDQETPCWTRRRRPKRLLFLSRIHAKKGLDLLVPAWGKLTKEFPDWELLVVGPDEGGYQATVEKMIADCGCSRTCWIHPAVSGAEKHALLRTADLFVLPSYSEGFPMAVLEAAAHRIPVVQTDECNFPELTAAGGAWECRPECESVEIALRSALTAEDAECAERGLRGRELVERSYSWDQVADRVIAACV
jgi:glycosyltransferase involved in cell wall biosynthesis